MIPVVIVVVALVIANKITVLECRETCGQDQTEMARVMVALVVPELEPLKLNMTQLVIVWS